MNPWFEKIKTPSFWLTAVGVVAAVAEGLKSTGNPTLVAIGAALAGVYTLSEHIRDAIVASRANNAKAIATAIENLAPVVERQIAQWSGAMNGGTASESREV